MLLIAVGCKEVRTGWIGAIYRIGAVQTIWRCLLFFICQDIAIKFILLSFFDVNNDDQNLSDISYTNYR